MSVVLFAGTNQLNWELAYYGSDCIPWPSRVWLGHPCRELQSDGGWVSHFHLHHHNPHVNEAATQTHALDMNHDSFLTTITYTHIHIHTHVCRRASLGLAYEVMDILPIALLGDFFMSEWAFVMSTQQVSLSLCVSVSVSVCLSVYLFLALSVSVFTVFSCSLFTDHFAVL